MLRIAPLCTIVVLLLATAAGAGGSVGYATSIWLANRGNANVLQFPLSATGNVAPTTTLSTFPNASCLGAGNPFPCCSGAGAGTCPAFNRVQSVQLDSNLNVWVLDLNNNAIYKFPAGVSGQQAPTVTISGAATQLNAPFNMCFDGSGDLWVANFSNSGANAVTEYSAANLVAGGNIAPTANVSVVNGTTGCSFD